MSEFITGKEMAVRIRRWLGDEFGGMDVFSDNTGYLLRINRYILRKTVKMLRKIPYCFLSGIYAAEKEGSYILLYGFAADYRVENRNIYLYIELDKSIGIIESIADIYPSAVIYEKRLSDYFGINFAERKGREDRSIFCIPHLLHPPNETVEVLRTGIYDEIHRLRSYLEFEEKDGVIKYINLRDGWKFEDVYGRLKKGDPFSAWEIIYKRGTACPVNNTMAVTMAVEKVYGIKPQNKARIIRILLSELERIINHTGWFMNLFMLMDWVIPYMKLIPLYGKLRNILLKITGKDPVIRPGTAPDIDEKTAKEIRKKLPEITEKILGIIGKYLYTGFVISKLRRVGKMGPNFSMLFGLGGPVLRGNGLPYDLRYTTPYLGYHRGFICRNWEVVYSPEADCYGRTRVRYYEIKVSLNLAVYILKELQVYDRKIEPVKLPEGLPKEIRKETAYVFNMETPKGRCGVAIFLSKIKGEYKPIIFPNYPSLAHFGALAGPLLYGNYLLEAPLTVHSLDIDFNALDM